MGLGLTLGSTGMSRGEVASSSSGPVATAYTRYKIRVLTHGPVGAEFGYINPAADKPGFAGYSGANATGTNQFAAALSSITSAGWFFDALTTTQFVTASPTDRPYTTGAGEKFLIVILSTAKSCSSFRVLNYLGESGDYQLKNVLIEGSNDGASWTAVTATTDMTGILDNIVTAI